MSDKEKIPGQNCPKCGGTGINRKGELCGYHKPDPRLLEKHIQHLYKKRESMILAFGGIIILAGHDPEDPDHERLSEIQQMARDGREGKSKDEIMKSVLKGFSLSDLDMGLVEHAPEEALKKIPLPVRAPVKAKDVLCTCGHASEHHTQDGYCWAAMEGVASFQDGRPAICTCEKFKRKGK